MSYGKEGYIDAFEELIGEYLDKHPNANDEQAEAFAEGMVWERYQDNLADLIDQVNDERKKFAI